MGQSTRFTLAAGAGESLTTYTFGTHTAKHTFCRVCGITSFYTPRSNPDGVAVTAACVDPGTLAHVEYRHADGRNWEKWFSRSDISDFSKPKAPPPPPPPPNATRVGDLSFGV
uniref:CENP-V/GFA domain-containing protein n=1 Tax=Oryza glumipatula TaxID=40148 RepID=A0A0E0B2M0_9ORYZ